MAELPTDLTAVVLRRLIIAATDCHHNGVAHSARLAVCLHSTSIALHLDPPMGRHGTPHPPPTRPVTAAPLPTEANHVLTATEAVDLAAGSRRRR